MDSMIGATAMSGKAGGTSMAGIASAGKEERARMVRGRPVARVRAKAKAIGAEAGNERDGRPFLLFFFLSAWQE